MFTTSQEIELINHMVFSVPDRGYVEKRDNSISLFYSKGHELIRLEYKRKDFMDVLKFYGEDVRKSYITVYGPKGHPVQYESKVKVLWIDVEVSHQLAQRIIARHEYEESIKEAGLTTRTKEIPFYSKSHGFQ